MPAWIITAVLIFNTAVVVYFVLYNCAQMLFGVCRRSG
jgi:hypothetical protein